MKQRIARAFTGADAMLDRLQSQWRRRRGYGGRLAIRAYMGYGHAERLVLTGRVLQDRDFRPPRADARALRNFIEFAKRMVTNEVPHARVRAVLGETGCEVQADDEGYFSVDLTPPRPLEQSGWHDVELQLLEPSPRDGAPVRATAQVLVPPQTARFGVISDIDDTVIWTHARNRLRMLAMLLRSNAHTRKPFKGVSAFYRALRDGASGNEGNPVFYVSSSPWNLYVPLVDFFDLQDIPRGPLLLRDYGEHTLFSAGAHAAHKHAAIENIFAMYPRLPFVLIGDSGEQDPEIYSDILARHPTRVRAIYIRNVHPDPARLAALDALIAQVSESGAQLVLAPDSEYAAGHAAAEGLISPEAPAAVRADKRAESAV